MAQGFDDLSGYTIDEEPSGYTKEIDWSNTSVTVQADTDGPGGKRIRVTKSNVSGATVRTLLTKNGVTAAARVEIAALVRCQSVYSNSSSFTYMGAAARIAGSTGSNVSAAVTSLGATSSNNAATRDMRIFGYVAGAPGTLQFLTDDLPAWVVGDLYWMVSSFDGTSVTSTLRTLAAPTTVIATHTGTVTLTDAGKLGMFYFARTGTYDLLAFGWGTNGDPAPMSAVSGDPPDGEITIGTISVGVTTATVPFSYAASDQDGFFYRYRETVGPGAWTEWLDNGTSTSISLTGLTADTGYDIEVVAYNNDGQGTAAADSFTTAEASAAVKGVRLTLYLAAVPQASITDITAVWWDGPNPTATPLEAYTVSTNGSGELVLDLDADTTLELTDPGFLVLWKADGTNIQDSLVFAGRVLVEDIQ